MQKIKQLAPGFLVSVVIAASTLLAGLQVGSFSLEVIGAPVFAIIIGMLLGAACPKFAGHPAMKSGIAFTSKKILQWAVIILGFTLNIKTVLSVAAKACL